MRASRVGLVRRAIVVAAVAVPGCWLAPAAAAGTINVTTTVDGASSGCDLRGAISSANGDAAVGGCTAGSGADTIVLPAGTHKFQIPGRFEENNATGDLDIRSAVTINGAGSGSIIEGSAGDRVMDVHSGAVVTLRNVVVTGGRLRDETGRAETVSSNASQDATGLPGSPGEAGGGIRSFGNLTLDQAIVRDNVAGGGGTGGYATPRERQERVRRRRRRGRQRRRDRELLDASAGRLARHRQQRRVRRLGRRRHRRAGNFARRARRRRQRRRGRRQAAAEAASTARPRSLSSGA